MDKGFYPRGAVAVEERVDRTARTYVESQLENQFIVGNGWIFSYPCHFQNNIYMQITLTVQWQYIN